MNSKNLIFKLKVPLSILLALLMLLPVASCKKKDNGEETTPTQQFEEGNPLNDIPNVNMDRDFVILSGGACDDWLKGDTGEPISDAKYKRMLALEEKFNVSVVMAGKTDSEVKRFLEASTLNDDRAYDLVQPHPHTALASMMAEGYFANLMEIETMHLGDQWYNQSHIESYTFGNNKLYNAVSDIAIDGQAFYGIVYNRNLMLNYEFETDIKTMVENGDWTMEALNEMVKVTEVGGEVGDAGTYGFLFNTAGLWRWMYAMDETILIRKQDGTFEQGYTRSKMTDIAERLWDLMYSHGDTVIVEWSLNAGLPTSEYYNAFKGGRGLMMAWDIGAQYPLLRGLDFKIGYAPLPKFDKTQKDYKVFCANGIIGIPASTKSYSESGLVFEYLAIHSSLYLADTFYEVIIGGRLSEYPEDYEMLMFLHSQKFFDLGFALDEKQDFLGILVETLDPNVEPDSIAISLKSKSALIEQLVTTANGIG